MGMSDIQDQLDEWKTLKHAESQADRKPTLDHRTFDEERLVLALIGDEHAGYRFYNQEAHQRMLDYCMDKGIHVILMGDHLDSAIRGSVGSGVFEQDDNLTEEFEKFVERYSPLAKEGLILGMHEGNHENRVFKDTGLNLSKLMARTLDVPHFGWGKLHYYRVGDQGYTLYTTHGASGARLPQTKIKACLDLIYVADADIYAMGHLHELDHKTMKRYRADLRRKTTEEADRHFILTGHYLDYWGSYGHMKSYAPGKMGSPVVKLHGDKKEVRVSL